MTVTIIQGARGSVTIGPGRTVEVQEAERGGVVIERVGTQGIQGLDGPTFNGFGVVDYSDADAPAPIVLSAGIPTWVQRDLIGSGVNNTLRNGFQGHSFWDNSTKLMRALRLREAFVGSVALNIEADLLGGTLTLALTTAAPSPITVWQWPRLLTAGVGQPEAIRMPFEVYSRNSFFTHGAKFVLTCSVPATVRLFSPEFSPVSMGPTP